MARNLMFVPVDDIHQIVLVKILHTVSRNQTHMYLHEARQKKRKDIFF
jgi:hypothetical protein